MPILIKTMIAKGITPKERKEHVLKAVSKFTHHITSPPPPGSVLNSLERLAVARIAREAITFDDGLSDNVCTRPDFDFFAWMENSSTSFTFPSTSNTGEDKQKLLVKIVYAIIRHQHRLNESWYRKTQSRIQSIFLQSGDSKDFIDVNNSDVTTKIRCHQIFCEILTLAITSSAIQMYFMALNEKILDLPSFEEAEELNRSHPAAKELNMMSLLNEVHWDNTTSDYAPYIHEKDVNKESREFQDMDKEVKDLWVHKIGAGPYACFCFAPYDLAVMVRIFECFYLQYKSFFYFGSFDEKCVGVTRFQLESVAAGYTGAVNCVY